MWTSRDVARNRGAFLPRTTENPKIQGEQGAKSPKRPPMAEWVDIRPSNKAETPDYIEWEKPIQLAW